MSAEELEPSVVSCSLELPICAMKNKEENVRLEKVEDRTLENRTPEDRIPEHRTPEDQILEHRTPEDRIPEDRTPEDQILEHRTPEDRIPEDRTPEIPEDRIPEDRTPGDQILEHRTPEDRIPEDRTPEIPEDRTPGDRIPEGSSADESEEVEPEPPPSAVRRKVSFADAFGLDLVSVKEYDSRDTSDEYGRDTSDGKEGDEYCVSRLFAVPESKQEMEVRLRQQKLEMERIEMVPGSTTIRGTVRVLNLGFHKEIHVRATLDGWRSHFDLRAEYVPGSSDGETDCFCFHLPLTPPFQVELGLRVEFCLRYDCAAGTFWANNGGMNYILFCHRRRRGDRRRREKESEKEKSIEESNQKSIRSCLKTISKKTYTDASAEISEHSSENKTEDTSCQSPKDCCKSLVDRRRKRQAARLAHVQDYFAQKAIEAQMRCTSERATSISSPSSATKTDLKIAHSQQGCGMDTLPIVKYHQIPLVSLDWATTPSIAHLSDAYRETSHQSMTTSTKSNNLETCLNSTDITNSHNNDAEDQVSAPPESEVLDLRDKSIVPFEDIQEPAEQSKNPSLSRDQAKITTVPCSAQGPEPEMEQLELKKQVLEPSVSLSLDTTKPSPGEETQTAFDTETQNSEAGDGISPEECTDSSDNSKVKENTHRAVKDTMTFTEIRDVLLTNRQAEGSFSERKDINKDSEQQVEMREFYTELHEEDEESCGKGQDETTTDNIAEIQSVSLCQSEAFNENKLCTVNKSNSELEKNEGRWFEGLEMKEQQNKMTNPTDGEEKGLELLHVTHTSSPTVCTDLSKVLTYAEEVGKNEGRWFEGLEMKEQLNGMTIEADKEVEDEMHLETKQELVGDLRVVGDNYTDGEEAGLELFLVTHTSSTTVDPDLLNVLTPAEELGKNEGRWCEGLEMKEQLNGMTTEAGREEDVMHSETKQELVGNLRVMNGKYTDGEEPGLELLHVTHTSSTTVGPDLSKVLTYAEELVKNEGRLFEGLEMKELLNGMTIEAGKEEDEMHRETKRELVEDLRVVDDNCTDGHEKGLELLHVTHTSTAEGTDLSKVLTPVEEQGKNEGKRCEGLEMKEQLNGMTTDAGKEEDEMCPETKRELVEDLRAVGDNCTDGEEPGLELLHVANTSSPTVGTVLSKVLTYTEATSPEEIQKTLQRLDGEEELPAPLPSIPLSCCRLFTWWNDFSSRGPIVKAFVYAILFVIFITAYLYDLPTCLALYLFSLCWWCTQGRKQRLDTVDVD